MTAHTARSSQEATFTGTTLALLSFPFFFFFFLSSLLLSLRWKRGRVRRVAGGGWEERKGGKKTKHFRKDQTAASFKKSDERPMRPLFGHCVSLSLSRS